MAAFWTIASLMSITVNIILAIFIFIMILWAWGKEYLPPDQAKYGLAADSLAQTIGLKDGDIVMKVGDRPIEDIMRLRSEIVLNDEYNTLLVKRNDSLVTLKYDDNLIKALNTRKALGFASIRIPFIISEI